MERTKVAIGLGSNIGDRLANLRAGRSGIEKSVGDLVCSGVYETTPLHVFDQPQFLNACCVGSTELEPSALLAKLHQVERAAGRIRGGLRYGPRILDLDLLMYGNRVERSPGLMLPHPRLTDRAFVLIPLATIAPNWKIPGTDSTVGELAALESENGVFLTEWTLPTQIDAGPTENSRRHCQ